MRRLAERRRRLPVAAAGKPSIAVMEALNSPIQVSGVRMRMFAAPFKGTAPKASVLIGVEMVGHDLSLAENSKVEVSYYAFDTQGKSRGGSTDNLTTNLRPETKARVEQTGFRMLNRLELAPGRYQLRVASHDSVGGTRRARSPTISKFPTTARRHSR